VLRTRTGGYLEDADGFEAELVAEWPAARFLALAG
jgi:hypothetical protein